MKFTEKEIQNYMWERRNDWTSLINIAEYPCLSKLSKNITPNNIIQHLYIDKLKKIESSLRKSDLIGCEVPLKKHADSTMRCDFLGAEKLKSSLFIIELKKSEQTERQAFTELLGYSSHFNSLFKMLNCTDLTLVLISPMKVRIVKESMIQSLIYDDKLVYALIPKFKDPSNIETLYLEPWIPQKDDIASFTKNTFLNKCMSTMSFVWHANNGIGEGVESKDNLNRIIQYISNKLEAMNFNGFTFAMQGKKPGEGMYPNQVVIGGINPYMSASYDYLDNNEDVANNEFYSPTLIDLVPGLVNCSENVHEEFDYLQYMRDEWLILIILAIRDEISSINGNMVVEIGGVYDMNGLQESIDMNSSFWFDIHTTGIIKSIYVKFLQETESNIKVSDIASVDKFIKFYNQLI